MMSDIKLGVSLERQMKWMQKLIDEYKGKELTKHRHSKLSNRFRYLKQCIYEAIESDNRQSQ